MPENLPNSIPALNPDASIEQFQEVLKSKKPTCSGIISGFSCGNHQNTPHYNGPVISVQAGDEVAMNSMLMTIVSIDGAGNGEGLIQVPMFGNLKMGVKLSGIQVAEGGCVVAGRAEVSEVSASLLNDKLRAELAKAYAAFVETTDMAIKNAGAIAETINGIKDFLSKAKAFARNYKGGDADAKKAAAYAEYGDKVKDALLNSPDVPEDIKAELQNAIASAAPAWEFYKSGQSCSVGGKGPFFGGFEDCDAYASAVDGEMTALEKAEAAGTKEYEYKAEIDGNPTEPIDDQDPISSGWVEVNGKMIYDSRVIDIEDAKALYGENAQHRPIGYIFSSSNGSKMELGNYGFYKQNGVISSSTDLAENSLTNTNPSQALAEAKEQITKKLKEYSTSAYVVGFITTDITIPEVTDGAWPKWVVYAIAGGIATHYISKMNKEIDRIMRRAGGPQGVQYSLRAKGAGAYTCYTCGSKTMNLNTGDVWKYGETSNPGTRYSESFKNNLKVQQFDEFYGNKIQIKVVEKMKIYNYFLQYGHLPPGNKIFR